jgi:membrane protein implicated in regulation of membrane protease activity
MDFVKLSRIQMIFWFAMAAITLVAVTVAVPMGKLESVYFFIPAMCVLLGFLRRWQLKRVTKSSAEKNEREAREGKK